MSAVIKFIEECPLVKIFKESVAFHKQVNADHARDDFDKKLTRTRLLQKYKCSTEKEYINLLLPERFDPTHHPLGLFTRVGQTDIENRALRICYAGGYSFGYAYANNLLTQCIRDVKNGSFIPTNDDETDPVIRIKNKTHHHLFNELTIQTDIKSFLLQWFLARHKGKPTIFDTIKEKHYSRGYGPLAKELLQLTTKYRPGDTVYSDYVLSIGKVLEQHAPVEKAIAYLISEASARDLYKGDKATEAAWKTINEIKQEIRHTKEFVALAKKTQEHCPCLRT